MPTNYQRIKEENIKKYGTDIDRYGPILLAKLYSDRTHFIYELLQNAEDAKATWVNFHLFKDRLEFRHNGRIFNSDDVQGICGLVESTKKEDLTQIGKFGIGFKSIYAYTKTPKIYSGEESFFIENYVLPCIIEERVKIKSNETLFIFPFNHVEVNAKDAFNEISKRLRELGPRVLLFLNNIAKIQWEIECEISGTYIREVTNKEEHLKRVCVLSKTKSQNQEHKEDWLIFDRLIKKGNIPLKVEIAFKIDSNTKNKKKTKELIVPINDACLVVFFPTEKETHLKFLIQGPYRTTPARDNIPKDDLLNIALIKETASLVADSLSKIKRLGLFTTDFLNVLPINKENFPEDHMFHPVYEGVLSKLKSEEKLLPASNDSHISAQQAHLARGKELIELLRTKQLSLLLERENCKWLDSNITQDRMPELWKYLIEDIGIEKIEPEDFAKQFTEEFIKQQKDEWVIRFYTFLKEQKALWRKKDYYHHTDGTLRSKEFIRLKNNNHVAPFDSSGRPQAYLHGSSKTGFNTDKTVKKAIADDKEAREFLEELGLPKPDLYAEVIESVLPKYQKDEIDISNDENLTDVEKTIQALKNAPSEKKEELVKELEESRILQVREPVSNEQYWRSPNIIYLTEHFTGNDILEKYFEGNPDIYFLDEMYSDFKKEDILGLGCLDKIKVTYEEPSCNGNVIIHQSHGRHQRGLNGFDPNCEIEGLEYALEHITLEKAQIIWNILKPYHKSVYGSVESSARQDYSDRGLSSYREGKKASEMGKLVRERKWLPDKQGNFHKPSKILLTELPDNFDKESAEAKTLAEKLGFKEDIEQELRGKLSTEKQKIWDMLNSLDDEDVQAVKQLLDSRKKDEDKELTDYEDLNYAEELKQIFNRPQLKTPEEDHIPPDAILDPNRRRELTQAEIQESIGNELPISQRFKRVPAKKWEQKDNSVKRFLREQYGGKCQICDYVFYKKNGEPYFEGSYLRSKTKAVWIDRPGNVLCLCANCCAKFQHGQGEFDNFLEQINNFKCSNEEGIGNAAIKLKLCGEEVELKYSERHILDLQELLKASNNKKGDKEGHPLEGTCQAKKISLE